MLDDLQAAEFLYTTQLFPELQYTFTHALTHDVAYNELLQQRRRETHAHVVDAMEKLYADRLGEHATFLGWLEGEDLARAYASADLFLFCSTTDTSGQVVLEAGASGLPVVAVAEGGPASLVENRHTGMLCRPDADHIAGTVLQLAASPLLRRHLGASAVRAVQDHSWERALEQLAGGYRRALGAAPVAAGQAPARAA